MDFAILQFVHPTELQQNEINRYKMNTEHRTVERSCGWTNEKSCVSFKVGANDIRVDKWNHYDEKSESLSHDYIFFFFFFWSPSFDIRNLIFILFQKKKCVERFSINFGFEFVYISVWLH